MPSAGYTWGTHYKNVGQMFSLLCHLSVKSLHIRPQGPRAWICNVRGQARPCSGIIRNYWKNECLMSLPQSWAGLGTVREAVLGGMGDPSLNKARGEVTTEKGHEQLVCNGRAGAGPRWAGASSACLFSTTSTTSFSSL